MDKHLTVYRKSKEICLSDGYNGKIKKFNFNQFIIDGSSVKFYSSFYIRWVTLAELKEIPLNDRLSFQPVLFTAINRA